MLRTHPHPLPGLQQAPGLPRTVVGAALNYRDVYDQLLPVMEGAPYKGAPKAPVLYIKPANTYVADGDAVTLPPDIPELEIGACLGVVFGSRASRVSADQAMAHVAGYRVVGDLYAPHESFYRPAIKQRCRDGFCPMGPVVDAGRVPDPGQLDIEVRIDGAVAQRASTSGLRRDIPTLIAEVTAFMSLEAGDVLLVGIPAGAPRIRAGQRYEIRISGVGVLSNAIVAA